MGRRVRGRPRRTWWSSRGRRGGGGSGGGLAARRGLGRRGRGGGCLGRGLGRPGCLGAVSAGAGVGRGCHGRRGRRGGWLGRGFGRRGRGDGRFGRRGIRRALQRRGRRGALDPVRLGDREAGDHERGGESGEDRQRERTADAEAARTADVACEREADGQHGRQAGRERVAGDRPRDGDDHGQGERRRARRGPAIGHDKGRDDADGEAAQQERRRHHVEGHPAVAGEQQPQGGGRADHDAGDHDRDDGEGDADRHCAGSGGRRLEGGLGRPCSGGRLVRRGVFRCGGRPMSHCCRITVPWGRGNGLRHLPTLPASRAGENGRPRSLVRGLVARRGNVDVSYRDRCCRTTAKPAVGRGNASNRPTR